MLPGTLLLQRYRVVRHVRREGLGDVYCARDQRDDRTVALKVLCTSPEQPAPTNGATRLRHEAVAAEHVRGEHLLTFRAAGEDAEHGLVLVGEHREGELLADRVDRTGPLPLPELAPLVEQLWMALAELHACGVLHRNVGAGSFLVDQTPTGERLTLLDFSVCRLPPSVAGEQPEELDRLGDVRFMPPEQIRNVNDIDHRADLYAAMTVVFMAITGDLPFAARNPVMLADLKSRTAPRRIGNLMVPPVDRRLEGLVNKGLAHDPARRFGTATEVLQAWRTLGSAA